MKIYICHWNKLQDRKQHLSQHLNEHGISNYEWVEDYDKEKWDKQNLNLLFPNVFGLNPKGRYLNDAEISLVLKHIKILKDAYEKQYEHIIVFEDDVNLVDGFLSKLDIYMKQLPKTWDMFWIGSCCDLNELYIEGTHVYPSSRGSRCTHAYMISKSGIQKVYNDLAYVNDGADWYYNHLISKFHLENYWAEPPLAFQNTKFKTSIQL